MSTADSYLLVSVQTCVHDIVKTFKPGLREKNEIRLSRIFAIVLPLGALAIALYIKNAYSILMFAWSFYAAAAGLPAFAALYWRKATKAGYYCRHGQRLCSLRRLEAGGTAIWTGRDCPGAIACAVALVCVSLITYKTQPSGFLEVSKSKK